MTFICCVFEFIKCYLKLFSEKIFLICYVHRYNTTVISGVAKKLHIRTFYEIILFIIDRIGSSLSFFLNGWWILNVIPVIFYWSYFLLCTKKNDVILSVAINDIIFYKTILFLLNLYKNCVIVKICLTIILSGFFINKNENLLHKECTTLLNFIHVQSIPETT